MDFSLNDEQKMLQDSVARFISGDYGYEQRQKNRHKEPGYSPAHWATFAELGWLSIPFSEDDGGIGGGPIETMLVMEQFGKGLVVEPWLSCVVMAGGVLARLGNPEQKSEWLGALIEGRLLFSLAWLEPQTRHDPAQVVARAEPTSGGYRLNGQKTYVMHGAAADKLIVSAKLTGTEGLSLFVVDGGLDGLNRRSAHTLDGHRIAEVSLEQVEVPASSLLGEAGKGLPALEAVLGDATLAVCAEAVGMMEKLYRDTVEYTRNRKQFGVPISAFQALQHRMVDMFTATEECRSLLLRAVLSAAAGDADAARNLSALKYQIGIRGQKVAHEAIQIHGGMGMTDEMSVGMYLKRINVINALFGDPDYHLRRFIALAE
jgi:alkylation response protein AidB-like acyl-CoA dehydrogenase